MGPTLAKVINGLSRLTGGCRGRMIETRQRKRKELSIMQLMTPEDARQVGAILRTHAEMQDANAMRSQEVLGRLRAEEPEEHDLIDDLEAMIEVAEEDSDNLKRLASMFGA